MNTIMLKDEHTTISGSEDNIKKYMSANYLECSDEDVEEAPYKVYQTRNYAKFTKLPGNRERIQERAKNVIESIEHVGGQPFPVIVNQSYHIVEGQARFDACKQLGLPIQFVIEPDADASTCRETNKASTSWNEEDFILSYAQTGNEDYKRLVYLHDTYGLSWFLLYCMASNKLYSGAQKAATLKKGLVVLSEKKRTKSKNLFQP